MKCLLFNEVNFEKVTDGLDKREREEEPHHQDATIEVS